MIWRAVKSGMWVVKRKIFEYFEKHSQTMISIVCDQVLMLGSAK